MNRLKLFLLILIIAALSIVFVQNREPIALKFLCPDDTLSCLYQTPDLPLAIWIGLFVLNGAIVSLIGQALNRYSYSTSGRKKPITDEELYPSDRNWKREPSTQFEEPIIRDKFSDATNYEVKQEPQNVERSGSTYSYKYREAGDRPQDLPNPRETQSKSNNNSQIEGDDEDWI